MHKMKVKEKYYHLLKTGHKTIELRLLDEKRKCIKVGDIIEFSNYSNDSDKFIAEVVDLYKADNFLSLCRKISCINAGFSSDKELIATLEEFYSQEKQKEFGVIGIQIKLI